MFSKKVEDQLVEDMTRFYSDPLGFTMYAYPWESNPVIQQVKMPKEYQDRFQLEYGPDFWAIQFLEKLGQEVEDRKFTGQNSVAPILFSTVSGHGIGKSTLTAWLILWIMSTKPLCKGTVTATTDTQLRTRTWSELAKWFNMCITKHWFEYTNSRGNMSLKKKEQPNEWFCSAQTCREENSESFAGQHSVSSTPFYIFDEASGVPDKIFEVREGGTTDGLPMVFDFGNPTRNSGAFFENCIGSRRHRYNVITIDSRDVSITNKERIQDWLEDYGEDSDFFKVRVRGQFPAKGVAQFIPSDDVERCMALSPGQDDYAPLVLGVDVARFGDDETVIYPRMGRDAKSFPPKILKGMDTVQVTNAVTTMIKEFEERGKKYRAVFVDGGGVGGGVVDQLKHLGYNVIEVLAQHQPKAPHDYRYRSDEMWGDMRDAIKSGLALPSRKTNIGAQLYSELTSREYGFTGKSQINLETKKDMKERGLASPNIADALSLTYYQDIPLENHTQVNMRPQMTICEYDPLNPRVETMKPRLNPVEQEFMRQIGACL